MELWYNNRHINVIVDYDFSIFEDAGSGADSNGAVPGLDFMV
jgi:hypothetical protein